MLGDGVLCPWNPSAFAEARCRAVSLSSPRYSCWNQPEKVEMEWAGRFYWCIFVFVLFQVMATAEPQLPGPYIPSLVMGVSHTVHLPLRNWLSSSQGYRFQLFNPMRQPFLGLVANNGRVCGRQALGGLGEMANILGFVFCLAVRTIRPQLLHFCVLSLPSAILYADYWGRIPRPQKVHLQPESCPYLEPQWAPGCILQCPSLHVSLLSSSVRPDSPTFKCFDTMSDLSDVFVCCTENSLWNYSCSICCYIKGRYQEAPLMLSCVWHHLTPF